MHAIRTPTEAPELPRELRGLEPPSGAPALEDAPGYSFGRAMRALALGAYGRAPLHQAAPLEAEVSRALADAYGREPEGLLVPGWAQRAPPMDSSGGAYEVQQIDTGLYQALQARSVMVAIGMQVIPDLSGEVTFGTGGDVVPAGVAEDGDLAESEVLVTPGKLVPRSHGVRVPVTRRLALQAVPALETFLFSAFADGFADKLDRVAIEGDVGSGVSGDATSTAVPISVGGPGQPDSWGDLTTLIKAGANLGGTRGRPWWVLGTDAYEWAQTQGTSPSTAFLQSHARGDVTLAHAPVAVRAKLADPATFLYGRFGYLLAGLWGPMDFYAVLDATAPAKGRLVYYGWQEMDVSPLQVAWVKPTT